MSLDCPILASSSVISNVYLLSLYCVLCIQCCMSLDCPLLVSSSVVSNVYLLFLSCVLCIQCYMCLWIVHYWFPLRLSLTLLIVNVSCVSMLYVSLDCPLLVSSSVVSNVYLLSLFCVLCIQCCMCLWIVHYWFPLRLSLTFTYCLYTVSCVFNVVCVSGLSIIGFLFGCL